MFDDIEFLPYLTAYKGVLKRSDAGCDDLDPPTNYLDYLPGWDLLEAASEASLSSVYASARTWYEGQYVLADFLALSNDE